MAKRTATKAAKSAIKVLVSKLVQTNHRPVGSDTANKKREDFYFAMKLAINGIDVEGELHLMLADGSIKADKGKYYAYVDLNKKDGVNQTPCHECDGDGMGGSASPKTGAGVPIACWEPIEQMLRMNYPTLKLAKQNTKSGFVLFFMQATDLGEVDDNGRNPPRGEVAWSTKIDCPIHGVHVQRTFESP